MSWRLADVVVFGEIINTRPNTVRGFLKLRDQEITVHLHLTGNCGSGLKGRHFRFMPREGSLPVSYHFDFDNFDCQQIGPAGIITLDQLQTPSGHGDSETPDICADPLGAARKQHLYLEWFSQNGRVVLDLIDAHIEFAAEGDEDPPQAIDDTTTLGDTEVEEDIILGSNPDGEDPYGLFPGDMDELIQLENTFEQSLFPDVPPSWHEMDKVISDDLTVPICTLFDPPLKLYPENRLDDKQVQQALQMLLARLAVHGICLDMCEHYTPRQAYCLLTEQILKEENVYPDLPNTRCVQHFMTAEDCELCQAEFEAQTDGPLSEDEE